MTQDIYVAISGGDGIIDNGSTLIGQAGNPYFQVYSERSVHVPTSGQLAEKYDARFHRQTG